MIVIFCKYCQGHIACQIFTRSVPIDGSRSNFFMDFYSTVIVIKIGQ